MATFATTGTKIYIGPADDTASDQTAYEALSYTEITPVESIGNVGDASNEVSFASLSDSRELIFKGIRRASRPEINMARDLADAGQQALIAAEKTNNTYAFKIVFNDQPAGGTQPTTLYFRAFVMGYEIQGVAPDNTLMAQAALGINTAFVEDAAA